MKNVFISYSSKQTDEALRICNMIEDNKISCFISTRDLMPGKEYASQLIQNIADANVVLLLLSNDSNQSPHVLREVEYAVSHNTPIIVYTLEEVVPSKSLEYFLMTHQWINDVEDKDLKLIESLQSLIHEVDSKKSNNKVVNKDNVSEETDTNVINPTVSKKTLYVMLGVIVILLICILCMVIFINRNITSKMVSENSISSGDLKEKVTYSLGDTITFGSYYNEPIEWRVIKVNEDGTLILISKYLLTMKAFDAAEGGKYNYYDGVDYWSSENCNIEDPFIIVKARGSNEWSESNIRTWLNSSSEVVNYKDQAPTREAVGSNFYSSEPGFLHGFTEEERNALVPVKHSTSSDLVFLLSSQELSWLDDADVSIYTKPTEGCKANDNEVQYYNSFVETWKTENYYWWLRDSSGTMPNEVNYVVTEAEEGYYFMLMSAGATSYGVRPAICIDVNQLP